MAGFEHKLLDAPIPEVDPPMYERAVAVMERYAVDVEELQLFMQMSAPDQFRCGYCDTAYVVPSLARSCETRHEKEGK